MNHLYVCSSCQVEIEALAKRRRIEIDTFIKVQGWGWGGGALHCFMGCTDIRECRVTLPPGAHGHLCWPVRLDSPCSVSPVKGLG